MRYAKHLAIILLIAFLFRLAPVLLYGMPVSYDAPFHINQATDIIDFEAVSKTYSDSQANNYPPLYHVLLASFSLLSGQGVFTLASIMLPILSALLCLSAFVFVRRISTEKTAIIVAFLLAIATPLIAAAYDSPENMFFFMLPLLILLLMMKRNLLAALLFALTLLINYFAFLVTLIPFVLAQLRNRKFIASLITGIILVLLFHLITKGVAFFSFGNVLAGMDFVQFNLRHAMPWLFLTAFLFSLPILYFALRNFRKENLFWFSWSSLSLVAIASGFLTPILRPWEQLKFLSIAAIFLAVLTKPSKFFKTFIAVLAVFLLITSILLTAQLLYPRMNSIDKNAINFLESNSNDSKILAAPAFSEYLKYYTELDNRLLTGLYFENISLSTDFEKALEFLSGRSTDPGKFLEDADVGYILINFEDAGARGTDFIYTLESIDKVYSLSYYQNCPFAFMPKLASYACFEQETAVFRAG